MSDRRYPISAEPDFPVAVLCVKDGGHQLFGPFWTAATLISFQKSHWYRCAEWRRIYTLGETDQTEARSD